MTDHTRQHHKEECQCEDCRPKDYAAEAVAHLHYTVRALTKLKVESAINAATAELRAENESLKADLRDLEVNGWQTPTQTKEVAKENERLRAALQPFADGTYEIHVYDSTRAAAEAMKEPKHP